MSEAFVPLNADREPRDATTFRLKVVSSRPTAPAAFNPVQTMPLPSAPPTAAHVDHQPSVTLQREGERITGARIQCSCGQVIELAFAFQAPEPPVSPTP